VGNIFTTDFAALPKNLIEDAFPEDKALVVSNQTDLLKSVVNVMRSARTFLNNSARPAKTKAADWEVPAATCCGIGFWLT